MSLLLLTLREKQGLKMVWFGLAWESWRGVGGEGAAPPPQDARYHKQTSHSDR